MKFFLGLLLFATLAELSIASRVLTKKDLAVNQKFRLNREPPLDEHAEFAEGEVVEQRWIEQRLNHFDPQDERRWNMRYLENNYYLRQGSPIFIYVGECDELWLNRQNYS